MSQQRRFRESARRLRIEAQNGRRRFQYIVNLTLRIASKLGTRALCLTNAQLGVPSLKSGVVGRVRRHYSAFKKRTSKFQNVNFQHKMMSTESASKTQYTIIHKIIS